MKNMRHKFRIGFFAMRVMIVLAALTIAIATTLKYFAIRDNASATIQSWQTSSNWRALSTYPPMLIAGVFAVYDPKLRDRSECLSVYRQLEILFGYRESGSSLDDAHRPQIAYEIAKLIQHKQGFASNLSWHFNGALLTHFLDCSLPKDDLLAIFLNEIYMGTARESAISGFQNGSQLYFSKDLNELSISQIALLIAIPQSPAMYDPRSKPEAAFKRRNFVIDQIYAAAAISQEDRDLSLQAPIED